MLITCDVNQDPIQMFEVQISGIPNKEILNHILERMWAANRWAGRFYCGVRQVCYHMVVEVSKEKKKDEMSRVEFINKLRKLIPHTKRFEKVNIT